VRGHHFKTGLMLIQVNKGTIRLRIYENKGHFLVKITMVLHITEGELHSGIQTIYIRFYKSTSWNTETGSTIPSH